MSSPCSRWAPSTSSPGEVSAYERVYHRWDDCGGDAGQRVRNSIEMKSQATKHPTAERISSVSPVSSSDLGLSLTEGSRSSETITPTAEDRVWIWPDMSTCCPKVRPVSIRSSPVMRLGGCVAKLETMKDTSIIPRLERRSLVLKVISSTFRSYPERGL